jgi:hypothetical protein
MYAAISTVPKTGGRVVPWNKGKLIGQKPPLKLKEIWATRETLSGLRDRLHDVPGGRCQGCCRVSHVAASARSGLSTTTPTGNQLRVDPRQRSGFARRARSYRSWRRARTVRSRP